MIYVNVLKNIFCIYLNKIQFSKYFNKNTKLSRIGYQEVKNFISEEMCDEIINYFKPLEKENSYKNNDLIYIKRKQLNMGKYKVYDLNTSQFFGIQKNNFLKKKLIKDKKIEKLFLENIGIELKIDEISLMVNDPDNITRQPLHVDTFYPTNFKFFVYLTDCSKKDYGPYTYVKKSHLHTIRKAKSILKNFINRRHLPQMELEYSNEEADLVLGGKGDGFMSNMSGVHGGYHDHKEKKRYMLVFQLSRKQDKYSSVSDSIN